MSRNEASQPDAKGEEMTINRPSRHAVYRGDILYELGQRDRAHDGTTWAVCETHRTGHIRHCLECLIDKATRDGLDARRIVAEHNAKGATR